MVAYISTFPSVSKCINNTGVSVDIHIGELYGQVTVTALDKLDVEFGE